MTATIHIDGGSRGNPGPASYAVVLRRRGHDTIEESGRLGTATNNVAEYTALVKGLQLAEELGLRDLTVYSDSELLVKQMNGEYRVKSLDLQDLYAEAVKRRRGFDTVILKHVRRNLNKDADRLCNEALDGKPKPRQAHATSAPMPSAEGHGDGEGDRAAPTLSAPDTARDDAIALLSAAADTWAAHGPGEPLVEDIVDRLQAILAPRR